MSVLLGMAFACLGAIAIAAIAFNLKRFSPLVADLRSALNQPPPVKELRLTMHDAALPVAEPLSDLPHAAHQPRSITRLLQDRERLLEPA
jgi:hypothetical protein